LKPSEKEAGKIAGLRRVQSSTWMAAIESKTGKSGKDLELWLSLKAVGYEEAWKKYRNFARSPSDDFVDDLDLVAPGTAAVYHNGPAGLPLWDLLKIQYTPSHEKDGKKVPATTKIQEAFSKRVLSKLLGDLGLYKSGRTFTEKCIALFEALKLDGFKGSWTGGEQSLEILVQNPKRNEIALSCAKNNLDGRMMVAIIATWVVSLVTTDEIGQEYAFYMMSGILGEPLKNRFGSEISEFIQKLYDEHS
jgi:hypothetical protein